MSTMKYRPEIDGLRAVAVIPVVLYHAGFALFSGGYVGVDVFFVISGYLITTILINDLAQGRFCLWRFYERRARRILPALSVVIAASIPFAWMWMLPMQFKDFAQSIAAVSLFASNILFWQESGYFAAAAEQKPLLHTWSLAVEEQYYLLFPLFLFFAWRYGRDRVFWMLVGASIVSFAMSEWGWRNRPVANFYLTPMRAWELFAGSLAAMIVLRRGVRAHELFAGIGIIAIVASVFLFDAQTPFPSFYTVLPVGGAVLVVLFGGSQTWVARMLSLRVFVGVGLISYSLYLWHQPLFAFARIRSLQEPDLALMWGLIGLAVLLAYLTWRFVEQPFRGRNAWMARPRDLFVGSGAVLLGFAAFGVWGHLSNGAGFRLPNNVSTIMAARAGDSSGCHNGLTAAAVLDGETCLIGREEIAPQIAIIGDSHAARISDALSERLDGAGKSAATFNASWCAPLMRFSTDTPSKDGCTSFIGAAITRVIDDPEIKTVILFAEWANYTKGARFGDDVLAAYVFDGDISLGNILQNPLAFDQAVQFTFSQLERAGKDVIVILPTPEYQFNVPQAMAKVALFEQSVTDLPVVTKAIYTERNMDAIATLTRYADEFGFPVLNAYNVFCAAQNCIFKTEKFEALYEDSNHLNYAGAQLLVDPLMDIIVRR